MTAIEWADRTWNPVTGCTKISEGCRNCYAERMAKRLAGRYGYDKNTPFKPTIHNDRLYDPISWKKPCRIFVCSMGDIFHECVPISWIAKVFNTIGIANHHTYIFLTKRPWRMKSLLNGNETPLLSHELRTKHPDGYFRLFCPNNIWFGVTAESQTEADIRIPILLNTRGIINRFVSIEPMLGPIDISWDLFDRLNPDTPAYRKPKINWVICGGESGHGARPLIQAWVRSIRDQCQRNRVPFFFKQWGEHDENGIRTGKKKAGREIDGKTWEQYPEVVS